MKTIKLRIHTWPEKILRKVCKEVKVIDQSVLCNLDEMLKLMRKTKGMGLAANQAGLSESLVVVEILDQVFKLINPRITKQEGSITFLEGCLSFPDLEMDVKRAKKILVEALDEKGRKIEFETEGPLA
ncbi:MAG: peptide deformylase, partial [Candidatus Omnitrophica bacterium]|nr:peptide deformylase [Candidatus Omnitrophota bacterium]